MLRRDRERWGMRECQAAWRFGVSVREYRELETGTHSPSFETWDRICKLYGWPQTLVSATRVSRAGHREYV
jgi:DNA-binding XRE family transcriptional regulator